MSGKQEQPNFKRAMISGVAASKTSIVPVVNIAAGRKPKDPFVDAMKVINPYMETQLEAISTRLGYFGKKDKLEHKFWSIYEPVIEQLETLFSVGSLTAETIEAHFTQACVTCGVLLPHLQPVEAFADRNQTFQATGPSPVIEEHPAIRNARKLTALAEQGAQSTRRIDSGISESATWEFIERYQVQIQYNDGPKFGCWQAAIFKEDVILAESPVGPRDAVEKLMAKMMAKLLRVTS